MNKAVCSNIELDSQRAAVNFWALFLKDKRLRGCGNLEKLLAGCEVIAAIDDIDQLLAAA
jgi:hypothetical protein